MATTLPGTVERAQPGLKGFDTNTVLTAAQAAAFKADGYAFCFRYLSRNHGQGSGDLSNNEAQIILNAGLALGAVQHVLSEGWTPTKDLGNTYGTNAAANAASIGLPQGMNLWLDLEGVATGIPDQQIIDYCNAWYDAVYAAGYIPGIYVGANCGLSGSQLYSYLKFQHYWKSLSTVPDIPNRGYQMVQGYVSQPVNGVGIDSDVTQNDTQGCAQLWLQP